MPSARICSERFPQKLRRGIASFGIPLYVTLWISGCVSVPIERTPEVLPSAENHVQIGGPRGPLSPRQTAAILARLTKEAPDSDALAKHLAIEQAVEGGTLYAGNKARVLRDGADTFPAMFAAMHAARQTLFLEYYIFEDIESGGEHLTDVLLARRAAGVKVAVLYDSVGSSATPSAVFDRLRAGGVTLLAFNPINPLTSRGHWSLNDRDHRKLLVADHSVAIIGGINMSADYESAPIRGSGSPPTNNGEKKPDWRDTDLNISGPAVIRFSQLFVDHWREQGGPELGETDVALSPPTDGDDVIRVLGSEPGELAPRYYATLLSAMRIAEQRLWITAAYFVPTHQEKSAITKAARRGVDVQLLVPSQSDSNAALAVQRSTYSDLLEAGVKIYEREGVILHTKSVVIDGVWAIIGSSNFDHRSVLFNDELDAVVLGSNVSGDLERYFVADVADARRIELKQWRKRPFCERLREAFWRLTTTLL